MSGAMSEGAGRELRDALVVWSDERAQYNLIIVIICVECGAEECGANFHAVHGDTTPRWIVSLANRVGPSLARPGLRMTLFHSRVCGTYLGWILRYWRRRTPCSGNNVILSASVTPCCSRVSE